ncbi:kinase-like domain-containing protein [Lactifluus volemus]|nr:kinase-like domain-containing protein [Lactifluus volemus]
MSPDVIQLKGASTKSDIWSLGCTVIELLTGRPPYGDIANAMTVMFRIVEDNCPPIPERFAQPLASLLRECFRKDLTERPSAEELFEHEWLKNHWGLNKDLRPQDNIPFLRRVSADLQKNDAAGHLIANLDLVDPSLPEFVRASVDDDVLSSSPVVARLSAPMHPQLYRNSRKADPDWFLYARAYLRKDDLQQARQLSGAHMMELVKKGVLCSHCSLIAHAKCSGLSPPTCDLRWKLLMYAQLAERSSPIDSIGWVLLDRERASSPPLSASSPPHPPVAYKVLSPFKRSHASVSPNSTHSNSSISLAGATQHQLHQ